MSESYESLESLCLMQEQEIKELRKLKEAVEKITNSIEQKGANTFKVERNEDMENTVALRQYKYVATIWVSADELETAEGQSFSATLIKLSEKLNG